MTPDRLPESLPEAVAMLAGMIESDHWLSADACAAYLGQMPRKTFVTLVATRPDFPAPVRIGKRRAWKRAEVAAWAEQQRELQRRQRAA